jgi:serine/threonine-protein kinase
MGASEELVESAARTLAGLGARSFGSTMGLSTARTLAVSASAVDAGVLDPARTQPAGDDLELARTLGEGGMGIVYLARQRSMHREVAVKRVRDASDGPSVAALLAEATVTGGLEHPSIVPVHALVRDARGPMMVMKRLEGLTLRTLIDEPTHARWTELGSDRLGFFVGVVRRLCDALALASSRGVVHRDVKPENVMIGSFGEVVLLDWGIAAPAGTPLPANAIAGTPVYMAPEMLRPATGEIDARSDVYLLGATLHDCVTGSAPHRGETLLAVLASVAASAPIAYDDDVPTALATLLHRAMHRDPAQRFQGARELGKALDAFVAHRASAALVVAADAQRAALDAAIDRSAPATEVHSLFHACRFAYEHALRDWPESTTAKEGRARALERMTRYALDANDRTTARSLLDAMTPAPAALLERLAVLDREAASTEAEHVRLKALAREHDMSIGARDRTFVLRLGVGAIVAFALTLVTLTALGVLVLDLQLITLFTVAPLIVCAIVLYRWRDRLLLNRISRQIAFTLVTMVALVWLHRVVGVARGTPIADVASGDAYLVSLTSMLSALTLRRLFFIPGVLFAIAGSIAPFFGVWGFAPMGIAAAVTLTLLLISPRALQQPALGSAVSSSEPKR